MAVGREDASMGLRKFQKVIHVGACSAREMHALFACVLNLVTRAHHSHRSSYFSLPSSRPQVGPGTRQTMSRREPRASAAGAAQKDALHEFEQCMSARHYFSGIG